MERAFLDNEAKAELKKAMYSDEELENIAFEIRNHISFLFKNERGFMVLRYERDIKELVIVALVGKDIINDCYEYALKVAKELRAGRLRFHSRLKGFERISKRYGFEIYEKIYYKEV